MSRYDTKFYDTIREGTIRSAEILVPLLIDALHLELGDTVLDVGCGEGWWAQTFTDHGIDGFGVDGDYVNSSPLGDRFRRADLTKPLTAPAHSVALSLEVAEHLPLSRASSFVSDLCEIAPLVVFSAAVPGQGGTGHINEQWPKYWADHFTGQGYIVSGAFRFDIWDIDGIENWYRQNLLICAAPDRAEEFPDLFDTPLSRPVALVHPVLYDARRR